MALDEGWLKVTEACEPMLNDCQSSAARALDCWIDMALPLWLMVALPPTTRAPAGSVVLWMDCELLSTAAVLNASATAAPSIPLCGTTPPAQYSRPACNHSRAGLSGSAVAASPPSL